MATYQAGFEALADATRRDIFERLAISPRSVGELAEQLPVSRPAVSQHLKVLKNAGLVTVAAAGTRRIYAVDQAGLLAIRSYFDQFWTGALDAFARVVDHPTAGNEDT